MIKSISPLRIVLGMVCVVILWIASGLVFPQVEAAPAAKHSGLMQKIKIQHFSASEKSSYIQINGETKPKSIAKINAEVSGKIVKVIAKSGNSLKQGESILLIDERDSRKRYEQAKSQLEQKRINYGSASSVFQKGLSSKNAFAEAEAQLKVAEAQVLQATIELENTVVKAPFDGVLDHIDVQVGDFVAVNSKIADFISMDGMLVVAYIPQKDMLLLDFSKPLLVSLNKRPLMTATVSFVSSLSDESTRSFKMEALLNNQEAKVFSGETAMVRVPISSEMLHKLPLIALNIGEDGALLVKTVAGKKVKSCNVEILEEEQDGVWVNGLPDEVDVILLGQEFVVDGSVLDMGSGQTGGDNVN